MQDFITSFLIQSKECHLPGIGRFRMATTPAWLDLANKKIFAPAVEILFADKPDHISEELIKYIADKKNITETEAEEDIKNWCSVVKEKLDSGEQMNFGFIGSLQKDESGNITLQNRKSFDLFEPVTAERVIHKDAEHSVLVGDKETTSTVMNQLLHEETSSGYAAWKIWAAILLVIASAIIFFHFSTHSFSQSATGNQTPHFPETPAGTYVSP